VSILLICILVALFAVIIEEIQAQGRNMFAWVAIVALAIGLLVTYVAK